MRGKGGRMYGNLMAMLTIMKGIPLAYNTDMSEDKEQVYDSMDTLQASLRIMAPMIEKNGYPCRKYACSSRSRILECNRYGRLSGP